MHQKRDENPSFIGLSTKDLSIVYNWCWCFAHKQQSPHSVTCTVTEIQKIFLVLIGKKCQTMVRNMPNEPVLCTEHAFLASTNKLACDCLTCLWHFHQQKGASCEMARASPLRIYRTHPKISATLRKPLSGECCSWTSQLCQVAAACTALRHQRDFH